MEKLTLKLQNFQAVGPMRILLGSMLNAMNGSTEVHTLLLLSSLLFFAAIGGSAFILYREISSLQVKILKMTGIILPLIGLFFTKGWEDTFQPFFPLLPILPQYLLLVFIFVSLILQGITKTFQRSETSGESVLKTIRAVEWKRISLFLLGVLTGVLVLPSYLTVYLLGILPLTDLVIGISLVILSSLWFARKYRIAFYVALLAGGVTTFLALFMAGIKVPTPFGLPGPAPKQDLLALIPAAGFFIAAYILLQRLRTRNDETNRPQ